MSPELYREVRSLFDRASDLRTDERVAFIEAECTGKPWLQDEVLRLLKASGEATGFMDESFPHLKPIGRYVVVRELGRGSMGTVYEAVDPLIERRVALKVVHVDIPVSGTEEESSWERMLREVRASGRLIHPGIAVIFDVGQDGDVVFFAMEKVDGPSLGELLASNGPLASEQALRFVREAAGALDYAHGQGIVHRDIKLANILLSKDGAVKIVDFGIARIAAAQRRTIPGFVWGTPSYMSPEQIQGQTVSGKSDQFSLAVVAYEMLTGERPFRADSLAAHAAIVVAGARPSARAANPRFPPDVDEVFRRALAVAPEDRYGSCEEFAWSLSEAAGHVASAGVVSTAARTAHSTRQRRLKLAGVIFVSTAAIVVAAFLLLRDAARPTESRTQNVGSPATSTAAPIAPPVAPPIQEAAGPPPREQTAAASGGESASKAGSLYEDGLSRNDPGLLRRSASLGFAPAMTSLGELLMDSDPGEAFQWLQRAAAGGDVSGMRDLGVLYQLGIGTRQDDQLAVRWFRRASDVGDPSATFDLAEMYEKGRGVSQDLQRAKDLYRRSADRGNSEAQSALARMEQERR